MVRERCAWLSGGAVVRLGATKPIACVGSALDNLRDFAVGARREAGHQLDWRQRGLDPDDGKPMVGIGPLVRETRVCDGLGAFRMIYLVTQPEAITIPHAFTKEDGADAATGHRTLRRQAAPDQEGTGLMKEEPVLVFAGVWNAHEETPEDTAAMRLRSELAIAVRQAVEGWGVAPSVAATRLGVTGPRLADFMRGQVGRFSLDGLVAMAERAT